KFEPSQAAAGYAAAVNRGRDRDLGRLQEEIEELLGDLWQVPRFARGGHGFRPSVDCFRTNDPPELTVVVELAGVPPESIELVAHGPELVVSGERRRPPLEQRPSYYQLEIEYGAFRRRVVLPEDADTTAARADYHDGLLTVVLPIRSRAARHEK